jgi:hypothetical protein
MTLIDQLPRLSAWDPGAVGEGGLDPLGFAAVADRIADVMAPGVRARMSQPRFVTLSAVGAMAYQTLLGPKATDGLTTVDIAFEWLVVEAMMWNPGEGRNDGLPGSQKAQRAKRADRRLSRSTYLNGPRVFGFTGVYRPFSLDSKVLTADGQPGEAAEELVEVWEQDLGLSGYTSGISGTPGGRFRDELTAACRRTLERAECAVAVGSPLLKDMAERLAPREAGFRERGQLRRLITTGNHDIRNELSGKLLADLPAEGTSQLEIASQLLAGASKHTRQALQAAIDFENAATALDHAFRRFLNYTAAQQNAVISRSEALKTPRLADTGQRIGDLVQRSLESVVHLGDELAQDTQDCFRRFDGNLTAEALLDELLARHADVQTRKSKLSWVDELAGAWTVRTPYRNQQGELNDDLNWTHQMRLTTLATFLRETA